MLIKELTRINELARTARARPLTAAENDERARLRRAYNTSRFSCPFAEDQNVKICRTAPPYPPPLRMLRALQGREHPT